MSEYTPDAWVVLEFTSEEFGTIQKVLGGWSGGYLDGDSWRLSSGITDVEETDTEWIFTNASGSIYHCRKSSRQFNMMSSSIYKHYEEEISKLDDATLKIIEFTRND